MVIKTLRVVQLSRKLWGVRLGIVQKEGQFFSSLKVLIKHPRDKKIFVCVCICTCVVLLVCVPLQNPGEVLICQPQCQNTLITCWTCPALAATGQVSMCLEEPFSGSDSLPNRIQTFTGSLLPFRYSTALHPMCQKLLRIWLLTLANWNQLHEVWESCYWMSYWHGQLMPVLVCGFTDMTICSLKAKLRGVFN